MYFLIKLQLGIIISMQLLINVMRIPLPSEVFFLTWIVKMKLVKMKMIFLILDQLKTLQYSLRIIAVSFEKS